MKRVLPLALMVLLIAASSAEASPTKFCNFSPTRGWQADDGGKRCRVVALAFTRVASRKFGQRIASTGCTSHSPGRLWICRSALYRTMNQTGDVLAGRYVKRGNRWHLRKLHFPTIVY